MRGALLVVGGLLGLGGGPGTALPLGQPLERSGLLHAVAKGVLTLMSQPGLIVCKMHQRSLGALPMHRCGQGGVPDDIART